MNETQKEKQLSTADLVVGTDEAHNGSEDRPVQVEKIDMPVETEVVKETRTETNGKPVALLPDREIDDFQSRWNSVQTGFVDEPRSAVEDADALVAELMKHLAEIFADERTQLENQWSQGDDVSTEDLRLTLQRYRSFFTRLLGM
jgi:hypothetical protein